MPFFYVFVKSELIILCRDIVLSLYRSSSERFRDKQLMSLYRLCRDIVLSRYSSVTYFTSFSSNFFGDPFLRTSHFPRYTCQKPIPPKFFRHLNKIDLPRKIKIFPPIKKELNLTIVKRAAQVCRMRL